MDNTYVQDTNIPIYIMLSYINSVYVPVSMKFPINPESLRKEVPSPANMAEIEGLGQIGIPRKPQLAKIRISSFFWKEKNYIPPVAYVTWLTIWQNSKRPALLTVTRFNYSMMVTCEKFDYWINAGEESDTYFELELQEYKPYGARVVNKTNEVLDKTAEVAGIAAGSVSLFEIPRKTRNSSRSYNSKTYETKTGETVQTITKAIRGTTDEWKDLYDENRESLADIFASGEDEIPAGTVLSLPEAWRSE